MWKFKDVSATQIFREIDIQGFRSIKVPLFAVLESLNFDFGQF